MNHGYLFLLSTIIFSLYVSAIKAEESSPKQSYPEQLKDDWAGLPMLPDEELRVWQAKPRVRFSLGDHRAIAEQSKKCSSQLISAQYRQDILKQFDAAAHFDNCAFQPSFDYIDSQLREVDHLLSQSGASINAAHSAMSHLGRITHALQDFYAHSNWIEIQYQHRSQEFNPDSLLIRLWQHSDRKRIQETPNIISGTVWWNGPRQCDETGSLSHGDLNKDSPSSKAGKEQLPDWNRTAYTIAFLLAERTTAEFLAWSYARWPLLAEVCGTELYLTNFPDRRPMPEQ